MIDALVLVCLLERLFCLGVQRSSFVETHIFASSQIKYKVWILFFSDQIFFLSFEIHSKSVIQVRSESTFGFLMELMECSGKVMIEKANRHCCPGSSGFCVAENIQVSQC